MVLRGIPGTNRCSDGGAGPAFGPVLSAWKCEGLVKPGWPDFNGVLVSPGLSASNYGGEKAIRQR